MNLGYKRSTAYAKALRQKHFWETERKPLWLGFGDHRVEEYKAGVGENEA